MGCLEVNVGKKRITKQEWKQVLARIGIIVSGMYLVSEPWLEFLRTMANSGFQDFIPGLIEVLKADMGSMVLGIIIIMLGLYIFDLG